MSRDVQRCPSSAWHLSSVLHWRHTVALGGHRYLRAMGSHVDNFWHWAFEFKWVQELDEFILTYSNHIFLESLVAPIARHIYYKNIRKWCKTSTFIHTEKESLYRKEGFTKKGIGPERLSCTCHAYPSFVASCRLLPFEFGIKSSVSKPIGGLSCMTMSRDFQPPNSCLSLSPQTHPVQSDMWHRATSASEPPRQPTLGLGSKRAPRATRPVGAFLGLIWTGL